MPAKPRKWLLRKGGRDSNSPRVVKLLCVVNLLRVVFLAWLGLLG